MRLVGVEPAVVEVESVAQPSALGLTISGIPEPMRRDLGLRLRGALVRHGVVDLGREAGLDLRVANGLGREAEAALFVAALHACGVPVPEGLFVFGGLGQSGKLEHVRGIFGMAAALPPGTTAIVPAFQAEHTAAANPAATFLAAATTGDIVAHLRGAAPAGVGQGAQAPKVMPYTESFDDVAHFDPAIVAQVRAAAAAHKSLLLIGAEGSGRAMLARRVVAAMPEPSAAELATINAIHSAANMLPDRGVLGGRPLRQPHHTISEVGLLGGGTPVIPGEVTLGHGGVLWLNDLPEYRRGALSLLAHSLKKGEHVVVRNDENHVLPARPLLVGTAASCPCQTTEALANRPPGPHPCTCPPERVQAYHARYDALRPCFDVVIHLPVVKPPAQRAAS